MKPIFGNDAFSNKLIKNIKVKPNLEIPESKIFIKNPITKEEIVCKIAKHYSCTADEIILGHNKFLRKLSVYFCKKLTQDKLTELGDYFNGLSYSAISQINRRVAKEIVENKSLAKEINVLVEGLSNERVDRFLR